MHKSRFFLIGGSFVLSIIFALVFSYLYGFVLSKPDYDDAYFTPEYLSKYSSPELAFDHFLNALISADSKYYREVLGRKIVPKNLELFSEKKPEIVKMKKRNSMAFIVTDNNWGEFFEMVNGRWVFTPEDLGVNIRALFKRI